MGSHDVSVVQWRTCCCQLYFGGDAHGLGSVSDKRSFLDDPVSWIASASTIGEIEVTSVADMASKLVDLRNARSTTTESALIGRLNIMDHSIMSNDETVDGIKIGLDVITIRELARFEMSLRKIHYCMSRRGFVHL
jgi:hypothetical protein